MPGGSGLTWTAIPVPSTVPHGLPVTNTQALRLPVGPAAAHGSWVWRGPGHRTLPPPAVEFPKAGPLHEAVQPLLFDQLQDFWLNLLL